MMNQQPDKLFRDKLENYQRAAPAPAWDRIEAGLDKKNKIAWPWLKIAAALLLVAMATWIFWPKNATLDSIPHTADHKKDNPKKGPALPMEKPPVEKQQAVVAPAEKKVKEKDTAGRNAVAPNKKAIDAPRADEKKIEMERNPLPLKEEATTSQDVAVIEKNTNQETVVAKNNSSESNIKIVFTANDAEKYLVKSLPDEATPDVKNPSRLQKLLDKADDLTTNQDPIGEIRQVKNEILALNFRSEKNRGQNK
jgi:hypothetical protein